MNSEIENNTDLRHSHGKRIIFIKGTAEKILQNCSKNSYPSGAYDYIVDMAEKGFILFCYAMKEIDIDLKDKIDYQEYINHSEFTFLGFINMEQTSLSDNLEAIQTLNESEVKLIYLSEQRELEATSKAVCNGICNRNELILCNISKNKDKIYCKGHI
jgi:magnesium-transporting ATPase (P-type)